MSNKKAFIFDTNFIIENLNLKEVVATLSDEFIVYVTQVSIEERISQKQLEIKSRYKKLDSLSEECKDIASVRITTSVEKKLKQLRDMMEKGYKSLFGENIIPLNKDTAMFAKILDRAYTKCPPFLSVEGASDKGFKDSLIWLSLLEHFKKSDEEEIFFVTNDNGFRKNSETLADEFFKSTGKKIDFKDNSYYKSHVEVKLPQTISPKQDPPLPDVNQLREKVAETINSLRGVDSVDYWGAPDWDRTFTLNQKLDSDYMEVVFSSLKQNIRDHLFEASVPANKVLDRDNRVENGVSIPIIALESALALYEEIKQKFPDYLPQFYNATALILNNNYDEPQEPEDDDKMPF